MIGRSVRVGDGYGAVAVAVGETRINTGKTPRKGFLLYNLNEVNILVLGDWQRLARELPSETPVIFRYDGKKSMETEEYCDGLRVYPARMWDGYDGWKPCVLVELGECF